MRDAFVDTVGYIDRVVHEADAIAVDGWVAAVGTDPIDSLAIEIAGAARPTCESVYGISSDDVAAVHPHLHCADKSRFRIRVPVDAANPVGTRDALVAVTPGIGRRRGLPLYHVVEPSLPRPSEENLQCVGGGFNVSFEFLGHLVNLAGLRPDEAVLDVGCGTGRIAYALAYYLDRSSRYEGFDVVEKLVAWAESEITPRYPHFRFRHANIRNDAYNPGGAVKACDFAFPYGDREFDLVFLTSVFTHMRGFEIRRYLEEIRRTLRPGGRCFATCFLLDDEARRHQARGEGSLQLAYRTGEGFSTSVEKPELAIGFDRDRMLEWIAGSGLELRAAHPGWWSGRRSYLSFQDILVFERPGEAPHRPVSRRTSS